MKMPKKIGQFWRVFENLNFSFKWCYKTGQFLVIEKLKCDITFWMILKHCGTENVCFSVRLMWDPLDVLDWYHFGL